MSERSLHANTLLNKQLHYFDLFFIIDFAAVGVLRLAAQPLVLDTIEFPAKLCFPLLCLPAFA